jgi:hypothetical protein
MRHFFHTLVDAFYDLLKANPDKPGQRWLLWISLFGLTFYFFGYWGFFSPIIERSFPFFIYIWPIWLPIILLILFFRYWLFYVRYYAIAKEGSVLLELKLPQETDKTPLAMEIFLTALYQTGGATMYEAFWEGKGKPWFSLELVSLGGKVKFFIWAPKKFKNLIESQLYAQYPTIEIYESKDYAAAFNYDPNVHSIWGTYFKLTEKDVYPIKTYVDYGMDKPGAKEEFKIDPMAAVLEYLGSIGPREQVWIQILIQAHTKEGIKHGRLKKKDDWKKDIDAEIEYIKKSSQVLLSNGSYSFPNPTPGQIEKIKALERSRDKFPFDTAIRGFYLAEQSSFNPINITGLIGSFRQYNSNNLNGFKLGWFTDFDYPGFEDFARKRRTYIEEEFLNAYKRRSFFHPPYKYFHGRPMILMTEELATIYHFPGSVVSTPTLERILFKKAEPPDNLPI